MKADSAGHEPTAAPNDSLSDAHRLVKALKKSPQKLDVTGEHHTRALQILHTLTSEAISRGWKVVPPPAPSEKRPARSTSAYAQPGRNLLAIDAGHAPVNIRIRMQFRKEPHTLTPKEEADKARGRGWGIPNWDFVPTDKIQVEVRANPDAPTVLRDGPRKSIEDGLLRALHKIEDATTKAVESKRRSEEWAIKRAQEEKERRELEQLTWQYESWLSPLEKLASSVLRHRKVTQAVEELTAYADSLPEGTERRTALTRYVAWANDHISATNPARRFMPPAGEMPSLAHEAWRRSHTSSLALHRNPL